jgi:hypothetical protein
MLPGMAGLASGAARAPLQALFSSAQFGLPGFKPLDGDAFGAALAASHPPPQPPQPPPPQQQQQEQQQSRQREAEAVPQVAAAPPPAGDPRPEAAADAWGADDVSVFSFLL